MPAAHGELWGQRYLDIETSRVMSTALTPGILLRAFSTLGMPRAG